MRQLGAQEVERVEERHVLLAEHRVLAELHQHRRLRGQLLGPLAHTGVEFLGREHPVDDPDPLGLGGGDLLAEQQQLVGLLAWHVAVDQRHDHEREYADVDLGRAESRAFAGDDQVAGQREPERAGEHVPVGGADRRLAELAEQPEQAREALGPEVLVHERHLGREPGQVGRRREDPLVRRGEHHAAHARIVPRLPRTPRSARRAARPTARCGSRADRARSSRRRRRRSRSGAWRRACPGRLRPTPPALVGAAKSLVTLGSWWSAGLEMTLAGVIVGATVAFPTTANPRIPRPLRGARAVIHPLHAEPHTTPASRA